MPTQCGSWLFSTQLYMAPLSTFCRFVQPMSSNSPSSETQIQVRMTTSSGAVIAQARPILPESPHHRQSQASNLDKAQRTGDFWPP
jgi:hypothetical protein